MEWSSLVTVERWTQTEDAHHTRTDSSLAEVFADLEAVVFQPSTGNFYRIIVSGNFNAVSLDPDAYRIVDDAGREFAPFKATYRAPLARVGESEHTVLFCEQKGERLVQGG